MAQLMSGDPKNQNIPGLDAILRGEVLRKDALIAQLMNQGNNKAGFSHNHVEAEITSFKYYHSSYSLYHYVIFHVPRFFAVVTIKLFCKSLSFNINLNRPFVERTKWKYARSRIRW